MPIRAAVQDGDWERLGVLLGAQMEGDNDLVRLLETWSQLPDGIRAAIAHLVMAASAGPQGPAAQP